MSKKETIIVGSHSISGLNEKIKSYTKEGYEVVGSHQVVETHHQNRYRGSDHMDTIIEHEYTITMVREEYKHPCIEVGIYYQFRDPKEKIKIYDEECMREEFEEKLSELIKEEVQNG